MKNPQKDIKSLAKLAKQRLKHTTTLGIPTAKSTLQSEEEKALTEKILTLLKTNYDTPTPIKELIDQKKFENSSPLEREIYIFNLIDKYNYYRDWYDHKKKPPLAI